MKIYSETISFTISKELKDALDTIKVNRSKFAREALVAKLNKEYPKLIKKVVIDKPI